MKFISAALAASTVLMAATPIAPADSTTQVKTVRLHQGMRTPGVAKLQTFLRMNTSGNYYVCTCAYDGDFGPATERGLMRWQKRNGYNPTGWIVIGSRQWNQLRHEVMAFHLPGYIDRQTVGAARQDGWAVDASKSPAMVNVLHYDAATRRMAVTLSIAASYGGYIDGRFRPTYDGIGHIYAKGGPDFRSSEWHNALMPWPAFFSAGEAIHYDPLGASHGCIHVPTLAAAKYIHDLPYGTTVVVHEARGL